MTYSPKAEKSTETDNLEEEIRLRVGTRLRELRKAGGVTAVALAQRAGMSQGQLSKIENGKAALSVEALARLCRVLDRPVGYLFQSFDEMPRVLGTLNTVKGPENEGIQWFANEVRRLTGGGLTLIALSPSQIGSADAQVDLLKNGLIDLFVEEPFYYGAFVSGFSTLALPYLFDSSAHRQAFFSGSFFQKQFVEPLRREGIHIVNRKWNWERGLDWVLAANRPIVTPRDLRGLRVRIVNNAVLRSFWMALGAIPVTVPWLEVGKALEACKIDVLPTRKAHLYPLEFCRHLKYVSLLGDLPPVLCVAVNEARYQILRPDVQDALLEGCDRAGDFFSAHVRSAEVENEELNISRFQAAYLKVDIRPWQKAVKDARDRLLAGNVLDPRAVMAVDTARRPL